MSIEQPFSARIEVQTNFTANPTLYAPVDALTFVFRRCKDDSTEEIRHAFSVLMENTGLQNCDFQIFDPYFLSKRLEENLELQEKQFALLGNIFKDNIRPNTKLKVVVNRKTCGDTVKERFCKLCESLDINTAIHYSKVHDRIWIGPHGAIAFSNSFDGLVIGKVMTAATFAGKPLEVLRNELPKLK